MFWNLTPWQLKICLGAFSDKKKEDHDQSAWLMWHGAALERVDKLPPLSNFLSVKKVVKGIDEAAILARLKQYQLQRDKDGSDR